MKHHRYRDGIVIYDTDSEYDYKYRFTVFWENSSYGYCIEMMGPGRDEFHNFTWFLPEWIRI